MDQTQIRPQLPVRQMFKRTETQYRGSTKGAQIASARISRTVYRDDWQAKVTTGLSAQLR